MGFNHRFGHPRFFHSGIKVAADWQLMFISQCWFIVTARIIVNWLGIFTRILGITMKQQYYIIVILWVNYYDLTATEPWNHG